jgi:apolipoprotein N-acyltransferase
MADGGQLLVVQTNNATYAGTGQLEQQFAISRYRAMETGRSVVVAATNGISGIIEPDGSIVAATEQRTQEVLAEEVQLADHRTPAMRIGGWLKGVLSVIALALTVYAYLGRRRALGRIGA